MNFMIHSIRNKNIVFGYLFSNDNNSDCFIELVKGLDSYPIFFQSFVNQNKFTINTYWTYKWIKERIVPYERKNINDILKDNNIPYYNELLLLKSSKGKSSMDDNYIEVISNDDIDNKTKDRMNFHIIDFIYSDNNLIIFLKNGQTKILNNITSNNTPFLSIFGNEIIFDSKIRYDYLFIKENGDNFPLSYNSLLTYINNNVLFSKEVINEFSFTRQYLHKIKKEEKIISIKEDLYLLNNIKLFKKI